MFFFFWQLLFNVLSRKYTSFRNVLLNKNYRLTLRFKPTTRRPETFLRDSLTEMYAPAKKQRMTVNLAFDELESVLVLFYFNGLCIIVHNLLFFQLSNYVNNAIVKQDNSWLRLSNMLYFFIKYASAIYFFK